MVKRLVKCRDCKHDRGYYSDSWCEKGNKQHSIDLFIECNDFIGYDEKEYSNKKQYGLNRESDLLNKQKEENIEAEKRYSHDGVVIIDHLKENLIYIDGKDELLELAEYVDGLQEKNDRLQKENKQLKKGIMHYNLLKEDIKTVLDYIGTNIILNYARMDDTYSLNDRERLAYIRLSKSIGEGYDNVDLEKW